MTEAPGTSLGARVLRGIETFVLGHAAQLAAALYITPILTHRLGEEGYALYALIGIAQGYLMMLNLGLGTGVQRYAGTYRREPEKLAGMLRLALYAELAMGFVGLAVLYGARGWLAGSFFKVQGQPVAVVASVLGWAAFMAPLAFALNFATNALYGLERLGAYNFFQAAQSILILVVSALVVTSGHGIQAVAAAIWGVYAALAAASVFAVRGELWRSPRLGAADRNSFFGYSVKTLVSQILWMLSAQGDRIVIGRQLPLAQLGRYNLASSLAQKLNVFLGAIAGAAFPIMTDLQARGEDKRLKRLYLKLTELTFLAVLPISIVTFVLTPQFFGVWLRGQDIGRFAVWPFRLLVIANVGYIGSFMPQYIALSRGAAGVHAKVYAVKVALLAALWFGLVPPLGLKGVALGLAIAEWLITPAYLTVVHRKFLSIGLLEYWQEACWRPLAASALLAAVLLPSHHLFDGWLSLIAGAAVSLAAYAAFAHWLLDDGARAVLHEWVRAKVKTS
ncbi:MAG: oligosaccharide flippase family protein [Elusimicrobia bacterium]|nr:oligosaccharide flippase family protein [Elusimicrobiota bacterium]